MLPAALLAISGCEKSSNLTAMQDETAGLANHYRTRFDELSKRYNQIDTSKSKADILASRETNALWLATQRRLGELRNASQQAQNAIAAATKSPNASNDLIRLQGDLRDRFARGEVEIVANMHAIESFISNRAYQPKAAPTPTPGANAGSGSGHDGPGHDPGHAHGSGATIPDVPKTGIHTDENKDAPKGPTDGKTDVKTDAKKDAPKTDAKTEPKKDAPKTDVKKDAPKTDAKTEPKKDAPKKDPPKAGSGSGNPGR